MSPRLAYASPVDAPLYPSAKNVYKARQGFGFVSPTDAAAFGPREHVKALHPGNNRPGPFAGRRDGMVAFAQRVRDLQKPWQEWVVDIGEAAWTAEKLIASGDATDLYFSQQSFRGGWRCIARLQSLGACYVDLDYRTRATHAHKEPRWVAEGILAALDDAGRPLPSLILRTGRGLCAVWLTETLPRHALPRWNAVQRVLAEDLTSFGADKRALDAARVFRLAGSLNSRADPLDSDVRLLWCHGDNAAPYRYTFSDLADEVLPHTRAELRSLAVERARRKAERKAQGRRPGTPVARLTVETWAERLYADLELLRRHRCPDGRGLPEGQRDAWLFCAVSAMAWLSPPEVLRREALALAEDAAGWQDRETRSRMSAVLRRAKDAAAGRKVEWQGREVDPRYRMRVATVIDWLEIDPAEQRAAGLRMLVDSDVRRELDADRKRVERAKGGATSRKEAQAARLDLGRKCIYMQARDGMNRAELAAHFGVSTGQVSKAMDTARKAS